MILNYKFSPKICVYLVVKLPGVTNNKSLILKLSNKKVFKFLIICKVIVFLIQLFLIKNLSAY